MKVYFNLIKGFYCITIILPVTTGFLNILLRLEVYFKCKFNTTALTALKGPYRNALKAIQNTSNRLAAIHILLQARGLLPDPNPRVPKYFRVSGRVSG